MTLSILIPVFNEEKTITEILGKILKLHFSVQKEIIVINDGSTDGTDSEIKTFLKKNKNIVYLNHIVNLGKGSAIQTGLQNARGDYVVIQDADLEYDPSDIPRLFSYIQNDAAQVVYGTRLKRLPDIANEESNPIFLLHFFGNRFLSFITSLLYGQWLTDMETCYKIFPKKAIEHITLRSKHFEFEPEITAKLLKKGYKIIEIPISTIPRGYHEGKKLRTFHDGCIALWTILKYRFVD